MWVLQFRRVQERATAIALVTTGIREITLRASALDLSIGKELIVLGTVQLLRLLLHKKIVAINL